MKKALAIEKRLLALENKVFEERKATKKVTFKEYPKKKTTNDPYDMEGLQKVLETLSNEMIQLKKQFFEGSSSK